MSSSDAAIRSSWESQVKKLEILFYNSTSFPKYTKVAGGSPRFNMAMISVRDDQLQWELGSLAIPSWTR
ncbi:hypothetical protein BVC80_1825g107 [Macleaya cordata]|uniref:Uncharacterized protein n=1 Tax=Macleaya cordata TaxID=56857 RepID=A0A200QZL1_MACCD|nr:hypothetical protein BVC80_1825g107 [Macleaya cordata]